VCREARNGACVGYAKKHSVDDGRHGTSVGVRAAGQCTDEANRQNCEANSCNVQIGSNVYCSQCKTGGNVPIDGVCVDKADAVDKCLKSAGTELTADDTQCGKCGDNHFLFKGGCYDTSKEPGNLICSAIDTANIAVCKTCAAGYFKNPVENIDATHQSCIACNENTAVDYNTGVANCAECTAPAASNSGGTATCTKCASPKYLKADGTCGELSDCTGTTFPKADNNAGNKCASCSTASDGGIADCGECSLFPSASGSSTTLITCTGGGSRSEYWGLFFPVLQEDDVGSMLGSQIVQSSLAVGCAWLSLCGLVLCSAGGW
ncbi:Variant-specific surface protein, partial [Giardia duodenalis]